MSRPAKPVATEHANALVALTPNQRHIVLQLFAGMRIREIAAQTGRRPSTIANTVRHIRTKLDARSEYDLMRECLRRGIVEPAEIYALADRIRCEPPARRAPGGRG